MKIVLAIPTATGQLHVECAQTLLQVRTALLTKGIASRFVSIAMSDVVFARNYLAAKFLEDKAASHLFFIDSDMQFHGKVVLRLLGHDKELVGCAYPKRKLNFETLKQNLAKAKGGLDDALALSHEYNVRLLPGVAAPDKGLLRVAGIGAGATLVRREVFDRMIARGAATAFRTATDYRQAGLTPPIYDFFGAVTTARGEALSEDYSFCHRWTEGCGGGVWAVVDEDIGHIGPMRYSASFARYLALTGGRRPRVSVKLGKESRPGDPGTGPAASVVVKKSAQLD